MKQKDDEALLDFKKRFKTANDVFKSHVGGPLILTKMMTVLEQKDRNSTILTVEEHADAPQSAEEVKQESEDTIKDVEMPENDESNEHIMKANDQFLAYPHVLRETSQNCTDRHPICGKHTDDAVSNRQKNDMSLARNVACFATKISAAR